MGHAFLDGGASAEVAEIKTSIAKIAAKRIAEKMPRSARRQSSFEEDSAFAKSRIL
jgi:hypothetical protein